MYIYANNSNNNNNNNDNQLYIYIYTYVYTYVYVYTLIRMCVVFCQKPPAEGPLRIPTGVCEIIYVNVYVCVYKK